MQKTSVIKKNDIKQDWYVIDAEGVRLGKLATKAAELLIGKHKPAKTTNMINGDSVVIINAEKIDVHKSKLKGKKYYSHSTYRGGFKEQTLEELLEKFPERVIEKAISGMLPKNKLRAKMFNNLHVYAGDTHKHEAQKPTKLEIK